jgi:hypothetical protein
MTARRQTRRTARPNLGAPPSPRSPWEGLISIAKVVLGVGLVLEGGRRLMGGNGSPQPTLLGDTGFGRAGAGANLSPFQRQMMKTPPGASSGAIIKTAPVKTVRSIEQRVAYIRNYIKKGSTDPRIIEAKAKILSAKCGERWCIRPKDSMGEIKALFNAVHDPRSPYAMRYAKDHVWVDQFTNAGDLLETLHSGDCDDGTSLLGALFVCSGYPVKMRVVQTTGKQSWSHIYLMVNTADANNLWLPIDWSVTDAYPGWEVPGAAQVAATGRPAGHVVALRDFEV